MVRARVRASRGRVNVMVRMAGRSWCVYRGHSRVPTASAKTQREAIRLARVIAANNHSMVFVYSREGVIRRTFSYTN